MEQKTADKINELADLFCSTLKLEAQRLLRSGMIDHERFNPDQYALGQGTFDRLNQAYAG